LSNNIVVHKRSLSAEEKSLWQETVLCELVVHVDSLLSPKKPFFEKKNMTIEAKIDLHGLSLAEGHRQCLAFLKAQQALGHRRVLVITGKGSISAARGATLRSALPGWLETTEAKKLVSTVTKAPHHLGGAGAYVVMLRTISKMKNKPRN
jgi:DNA-nicking Smr family endonuclease